MALPDGIPADPPMNGVGKLPLCLVLSGGGWFGGLLSEYVPLVDVSYGMARLSPAYQFQGAFGVRPSVERRGAMDVQRVRQFVMIAGLPSVRSMVLRADSILTMDDLDRDDRREVEQAFEQVRAFVAAFRREVAGISPRIELVRK